MADNGNAYNGQIKDGLFHGRGTLVYVGNERYEGEWIYGKREGQGRFTYADGAVFEGAWQEDRIHGQGIAVFASGNRYEGSWENGRIHGYGTLTYSNKDQYDGDWHDGKMHGRGTYRYAEGDVYQGAEMQITEVTGAVNPAQDGYAFTHISTDMAKTLPGWHSKENEERFFRWGIKLQKDVHIAKFRFNQQFRLVNTEEFLKQLFSSEDVQNAFKPLEGLKSCEGCTHKQINCQQMNMSFFDIFEEIGVVCTADGRI